MKIKDVEIMITVTRPDPDDIQGSFEKSCIVWQGLEDILKIGKISGRPFLDGLAANNGGWYTISIRERRK